MSHKTVKIGVTVLILAVAFGALLYTSLGENAEYYKRVDEVMAAPEPWYGKRLQVHGYVEEKSWVRKPGSLEFRFKVQNNGQTVQAYYTGILPDTFQEGSEVVLRGTLGPDGLHVVEDGVIAKCPSKYEEARIVTAAVPAGTTGEP